MIQVLWDQQTDVITDVKLDNSDADTYIFEPMEALLYRWEKINKYKHGKHCQDQQKHFSPIIISVNGMLGRESLVVLANLSRLMAVKMDEPISHVQGWINGQIEISVAR